MGIAKTNANSRTKNKSMVRFILTLFMCLSDQIVKLLVDRKTLTYYFNYMIEKKKFIITTTHTTIIKFIIYIYLMQK